MSASAFRKLSIPAIAKLSVWEPDIQKLFIDRIRKTFTAKEHKTFLSSITVKRLEPISVIYSPTTMKSEKHITDEFKALVNRAAAFDLVPSAPECYGLMLDFPLHTSLEKCRYKVCLRTADGQPVPSKLHEMKIDGGKYAVFPLKGDIESMIRHALLFFNDWLKEHHYRISDLYSFERFTNPPTAQTYSMHVRELYVPIKPIGSTGR
jgi:DNA gyrase inhibitor GyrI